MSDIKPFLQRRARRTWSGLAVAGVVGAVATALVVALVAGQLVAGSLLAHASPAKLLAATGGTLLAALAGGLVVGPLLAWRQKTGRLTPLWALVGFLAPLLLALAGVVLGWPAVLRLYAPYLLSVFALQALLSWSVFAYWSFPPYSTQKTRRPKPRAVPTVEPVDPSPDQED
jgi:hypothetical protein